jgi:hypothetical protein
MQYSTQLAVSQDAPLHITEITPNTVHAQWAFYTFMDRLGWAEHTGDWDWWIDVKLTNGETVMCDCGSQYVGMTDTNGKFWDDPFSFDLPFFTPGTELVSVTILRFNSTDAELSEEEREGSVIFDLSEIAEIAIGYDT